MSAQAVYTYKLRCFEAALLLRMNAQLLRDNHLGNVMPVPMHDEMPMPTPAPAPEKNPNPYVWTWLDLVTVGIAVVLGGIAAILVAAIGASLIKGF